MPEKHDSKDKPLYKMTLPELQTERSYREAIRHACDRDDHKIHNMLKSNLREAERVLHCMENNLPLNKEDFETED